MLTDEQCMEFRRMPGSFNDMVRAIYETGRIDALKDLLPKEKEDPVPYGEILDKCNKILGKNMGATGSTKRHIRARWNEGMKVEDFEKVCRIKFEQWDSDPHWRRFLRPETLFGTKMDSYCNEETTNKRRTIEEWQ